ncbi:MAG TPA: hypothetical protein VFB32_00940 [Rudaea sp.]|nr:hypothetical protein [Rudaea sp.]
MRLCILALAALVAPAFAQEAPKAPLTPELTPEQKLAQYRHDQINLLALKPDAESVLAAAIIADSDPDEKNRPAALHSRALLKRAQTIGAEDVLVWWVTASAECHAEPKTCPQTETLAKLEHLDAENAAMWSLALWHAQQAGDAPGARAALASAAQAKHYDDHFGAIVAALYDAQGVLPMSDDLLNATGQNASVDGYRLISAAGLAAVLSLPGYRAIADACKAGEPADQLADCAAVAKKMAASGSLNSERAGIKLREALLPPGPELDAARARERSLAWQTLRISELAGRLATEGRLTRAYTQALAETHDESQAVYAVLRSQGIALEPPADWEMPDSALKNGP